MTAQPSPPVGEDRELVTTMLSITRKLQDWGDRREALQCWRAAEHIRSLEQQLATLKMEALALAKAVEAGPKLKPNRASFLGFELDYSEMKTVAARIRARAEEKADG